MVGAISVLAHETLAAELTGLLKHLRPDLATEMLDELDGGCRVMRIAPFTAASGSQILRCRLLDQQRLGLPCISQP
jgi:hypothetical protein